VGNVEQRIWSSASCIDLQIEISLSSGDSQIVTMMFVGSGVR
jgi:hypothetical protein